MKQLIVVSFALFVLGCQSAKSTSQPQKTRHRLFGGHGGKGGDGKGAANGQNGQDGSSGITIKIRKN